MKNEKKKATARKKIFLFSVHEIERKRMHFFSWTFLFPWSWKIKGYKNSGREFPHGKIVNRLNNFPHMQLMCRRDSSHCLIKWCSFFCVWLFLKLCTGYRHQSLAFNAAPFFWWSGCSKLIWERERERERETERERERVINMEPKRKYCNFWVVIIQCSLLMIINSQYIC